MKNLIKAVIAVMNDVKGIEKSMTVGEGKMSYKGVPDKEVKKIIGSAMAKHGLCILPIGVKPTIKIERWEEPDNYGKIKQKQSVFTEVVSTYLLMHESGESQEICGYGHGVDSQDKGAGKATTYALKYALLYSFLVPTGDIDDADTVHSQEYSVKPLSISKEELNILEKQLSERESIESIMILWNTIEPVYQSQSIIKDLFSKRKKQLS